MKDISLKFLLLVFLIFLTLPTFSSRRPDTRRILFLGNSITYAGSYVTDIEAYLVTRYPGQKVEFINAGLPSETVSGLSERGHASGKFPRPDLHERLARVLEQTRPDLVFACYGMNDGIYLPLDDERFQKFKEGIRWLHDEVVKTGARIIHLTPPVFDEVRGGHEGYGVVLDRYADWLLSQREEAKWEVADVHYPMKKYLEEKRQADPSFALADDGIHPGETGHWVMAKQVLLYLGETDVAYAADVKTALSSIPNGDMILALIGERQSMMKDTWLTVTKHNRPGMNKGLPMKEARKKSEAVEEKIRLLLGAR